MTMLNKPISKSDVEKWQLVSNEASLLEDVITNRITYILTKWFEAFGGTVNTWYFDGANEGEIGNLFEYMNNDIIWNIRVDMEIYPKSNDRSAFVIIDRFGSEYQWQNEIPTRWLFEDFEQEIFDGKTAFEEAEKHRKEKSKLAKSMSKKKQRELAEQAKAKLTKEELKALKSVF